ncbi:RxLR effector protein [Phytophthora megakarya]|uniref:RxLR effector protein n=1 Tax=Phytophthora megakarya TaxID=4795 RepID=A0A225WFB1_9STRA|nr:RxLR effector protein [Phytophthora megakarya]
MAILTTLMTKYGDDALPKLLTEAKRVSSTNVIARNLEEAQLMKWVADKMSIDSIFNLLKLDEAGGDLFKSPLLSTWVKYAFKLEKQPQKTISVAIKLEKVELEQWLSNGKSSEEAFKLLSLNDETGNLLKNPTFNTWVSCVTNADKENPYDVVFAKLSTRYDDEDMFKLIFSAKQDSKTYAFAKNLELPQLKAWARDDKSPSDVFKLLSLQVEEGIDLLKSDKLRVWVAYVEQLKKNPDEVLLNELKLRYNDENLASMLAMSKTDYNSKQTGERLESFLQNNWIGEDKTAQDVFKLMKLEREGDAIFTSPMWSSWNSYVLKVSKDNPDESMYLILKSQFGEEKLKTMIGAAKENRRTKNIADKLQEEIWRSEGKSADDIFKLLKLNEKKEKFFEGPMLSTWISYVTKLEKFKVNPNEFVIITYLEKQFGEVKLAHILTMEKKQNHVATTKKVITDLQGMQFKRWMTEAGVDPNRLELMLLDGTSEKIIPANLDVILDFQKFYKANGGSPFYRYT